MTTTHDIAALCAAIDAGDDSALLPLADALEESGDPLADAVRKIDPAWKPWSAEQMIGERTEDRLRYGWSAQFVAPESPAAIPDEVWGRLRPALDWIPSYTVRSYATRSAAYLALAEALAPVEESTSAES